MIRRKTSLIQYRLYLLAEALVAKLHSRNVYRHGNGRQALVLPLSSLEACCPDYPFTDGQDDAAHFGDADKAVRSYKAQLRMSPAQERFQTDNVAARDTDLGLV